MAAPPAVTGGGEVDFYTALVYDMCVGYEPMIWARTAYHEYFYRRAGIHALFAMQLDSPTPLASTVKRRTTFT